MSDFPWNFIWSPGFRFSVGVSKIISFVVWFSSWIVVLYWDCWIDWIIAVWIGFDWARRVRVRIPIRVRMRVSFESFMPLRILLRLCLLERGLIRLLVRRI